MKLANSTTITWKYGLIYLSFIYFQEKEEGEAPAEGQEGGESGDAPAETAAEDAAAEPAAEEQVAEQQSDFLTC